MERKKPSDVIQYGTIKQSEAENFTKEIQDGIINLKFLRNKSR